MKDSLPVRSRTAPAWFTNPWLMILVTAVIGVPSVIFGLFLFGVFVANPVTWFVAGAVWFAVGFRHYRHRLTIRDTPMSKIDAAAIGLVEVSGRVLPPAHVETAPISGTPCVYWQVKVESRHDDKTSTHFDKKALTPSFQIEDSTGHVVIWPWAAELIVTDTRRWEGPAAFALADSLPPGGIREILKRSSGSHLVITEEKVDVGKTLYVIGVLSERHRVTRPKDFRERFQDRLQPRGEGGSMSNADAAKVFVQAILMVVVGLASGRFLSRLHETTPLDLPPDIDAHEVMIWRGEQDRPFIIADTAEGVVITTLNTWTMLGLLGGAGVMVGTVVLYLGGFFS